MRRFTWISTLRAILATVVVALTMGFVPGADSGATAGTVGPNSLSDTMGFLDGQIVTQQKPTMTHKPSRSPLMTTGTCTQPPNGEAPVIWG